MDYSRKEIIDLLEKRLKDLKSWYIDKPIEAMNSGPDGAWTAGQHLLHLIKSTKPLAKGVGYPRLLLLWKFGRVKQSSRSYDETIQYYKDSLANGGKATGQYVPRPVNKEEREVLVGRFGDEMRVLINNLHQWSEKNLDKTAVPHPLLGKLTLREMLYFTVYHMERHLRILEERY